MTNVGFVGLGLMGSPMAMNVLKAGFPLTVYNRTAGRTQAHAAAGATVAPSLESLAERVDIVCSCVTGPRDVEAIYLGQHGLLDNLKPGSLAIEMSTIDPATQRGLGTIAAERGIGYLDSPVSGGVGGAREGTLTIIVGGDANEVERARPVLEAIGRRMYHAGPLGAGATAKLMNQLISSVNAVAAIEGMLLGTRAGIDPRLLHEILTNSSATSAALVSMKSYTLAGNFEPGFTIDNMDKDVGLALQLARELRVPLFAGSVAQQFLRTAQAAGLGDRHTAAQILPFERLLGVEVRADQGRSD
jgi:3-hydroxyisobutyrate dehydrogenase-like beta-hydroxyacid dehydrogenase